MMNCITSLFSAGPNRVPVIRGALVAALIGCAALSVLAPADVFNYTVARQLSYYQISDDPPQAPEYWALIALLFYDVDNEVLSSTLEFDVPPPMSYDLHQAIPTLHQFSSSFYTSQEAFLADFPETEYTITADRGRGYESGLVYVAADLFCPEIPQFTGDTHTRLQNFDAATDFDVTINGFTLAEGVDRGSCSAVIVEELVGGVFVLELSPSDTGFQIPAGTLRSSTNYSMSIQYTSVVQIANAGFGGTASSGAEFDRATTMYFTTRADSLEVRGDMNCDGSIDFNDIDPFVTALISRDDYESQYPKCNWFNGDINEDGGVDFNDIDGFIECLINGGCA